MNPYKILGLSAGATGAEIRDAYRRLAQQHHPDKGGDAEMFQAVKKAFEALRNVTCNECGGTGHIKTRRGYFVDTKPCPRCWNLE